VERALAVLRRYSTNVDLLKHVTAVAACLKHFARIAGEDEKYWEEIGILHGLAYEMFYDVRGQKSADIFVREKLSNEQIRSIMAHGFGSLTDVVPNCYMEYVFVAVDQIAQFAIAPHEVRDFETIKQMFINKEFAVGTKRIKDMCAKMDKDVPSFLIQTLAIIHGQ